jgi:hypothetical protein
MQHYGWILIVVLPYILISSKLFCQQMHSVLKHKMLELALKMSVYMASTYFRPFGPSSGSLRRNIAKVTVFVEIINNCCCAVAICASVCSVCTGCCAACDTPHSTQYTQHILPQHSYNFNDIFLLIISTKNVTLAMFRRRLPDDGPNGPKYVEAIQRDILSACCNILCFNKVCICWQKSFELTAEY